MERVVKVAGTRYSPHARVHLGSWGFQLPFSPLNECFNATDEIHTHDSERTRSPETQVELELESQETSEAEYSLGIARTASRRLSRLPMSGPIIGLWTLARWRKILVGKVSLLFSSASRTRKIDLLLQLRPLWLKVRKINEKQNFIYTLLEFTYSAMLLPTSNNN